MAIVLIYSLVTKQIYVKHKDKKHDLLISKIYNLTRPQIHNQLLAHSKSAILHHNYDKN
jgi:hypothetical protein